MTSNRKITVNQYEYMELHKNFEDGLLLGLFEFCINMKENNRNE